MMFKDYVLSLFIITIVFLVFANSFSNEFVYDDQEFVVTNQTIKTFV